MANSNRLPFGFALLLPTLDFEGVFTPYNFRILVNYLKIRGHNE
ncbi:hypothetical protein [Candidatus Borreliella tachyglossi]|nr:hypothetical protein [Candidatus Borreliella tachyglossi]